MAPLVWVCVGGAVGSGARYLVTTWVGERSGTGWPWSTLTVNVVGSFLLGFLVQRFAGSEAVSPLVRLTLTTGVLGGFTTYSAFNQETLALFERGEALRAGLYVLATLTGCLVAGVAGTSIGRSIA
jgi:fluoride exporter